MNKPFHQVVEAAQAAIDMGAEVFQQWTCLACETMQTMEDMNKFYTSGKCEECGYTTDFVQNGCAFVAIWGGKSEPPKGELPPRW